MKLETPRTVYNESIDMYDWAECFSGHKRPIDVGERADEALQWLLLWFGETERRKKTRTRPTACCWPHEPKNKKKHETRICTKEREMLRDLSQWLVSATGLTRRQILGKSFYASRCLILCFLGNQSELECESNSPIFQFHLMTQKSYPSCDMSEMWTSSSPVCPRWVHIR